MKKIVINGLQYKQQSSGIGVLSYQLFGNLIKYLHKDIPVEVLLLNDSPDFSFDNGHTKIIRSKYQKKQNIKRNLFQSLVMGQRHCKDSILLTTDSKIPFFLPKSCSVVSVITDMALFRMPGVYKSSRVFYWKLQYGYLKKKTVKYIAISEFTKKELMRTLNIPEEKIEVIYCSTKEDFQNQNNQEKLKFVKDKYQLPENYFLFVGNFNPRKNIERMIKAFDLYKKEEKQGDHKLVIVGETGWKFKQQETLQNTKHRNHILFIGYVDDEDMSTVYTMAEAFLFPTLYEGFGIPVVEAQKCRVPVITSNLSALPEVSGEGAIYVDPYDIEAIKEAMIEVHFKKEELIEKGIQNSRRFSWSDSAKKLETIISSIINPSN